MLSILYPERIIAYLDAVIDVEQVALVDPQHPVVREHLFDIIELSIGTQNSIVFKVEKAAVESALHIDQIRKIKYGRSFHEIIGNPVLSFSCHDKHPFVIDIGQRTLNIYIRCRNIRYHAEIDGIMIRINLHIALNDHTRV